MVVKMTYSRPQKQLRKTDTNVYLATGNLQQRYSLQGKSYSHSKIAIWALVSMVIAIHSRRFCRVRSDCSIPPHKLQYLRSPTSWVDKYFQLGEADCIAAADNNVSKRNILQLFSVRQSSCGLRSLQYPTRLVLSTLSSPSFICHTIS